MLTTEGPVLVLAGAGTGKTAALTARLANLIATRKAWPSQILAVTFTNKAAREMKERVAAISGGAIEGMPWLGTFHSVAARMLRSHAELVGLQSNFTILDTDDQLRVLKQLISAANLDEKRWPARQLAGLIDRWKNRGWTPKEVDLGEAESFGPGRGRELYAAYQDRLRTLNACDFGDLLLHMLAIFRTHPDVLEQYRDRFRYILVDEYQDTNQSQYAWLKLLAEPRRNLCCVGDDDQSIYSLARRRGRQHPALREGLPRREGHPPRAELPLDLRTSSPPPTASSPTMPAASARRLWTDKGDGEKVKVIGIWDGPEEARRIGEDVEGMQRRGLSLDDVAILVRAQFQTREFEERFIAIGLPYQIIGGFRFYERAEIRDALAYLRLIHQPADDLAFERIVNQPKRGLGDKAIATIHAHARATQEPLLIAAAQLLDTDELQSRARSSLGRFVADIARWRQMASELPHPELARIMLDESGYTAMLQAERSAESAGRLENLAELARAMEEYETLPAFLEHVSLVMDNDENRQGEKVTIMTIHAAKGLEFDIVYLPGWEEGIFPSQRALDEGGLASLEEERRLAYVAITRARSKATVLHAANRRIYGQWTSSLPSRFVGELPEEHIEEETTMTGGESLWRAQWSERADPFAHLGPAQSHARRDPRPRLAAREPQRPLQPRPAARDRGQGLGRLASATRAAPTWSSASACSTASSATARSSRRKATSSRSSSSMRG